MLHNKNWFHRVMICGLFIMSVVPLAGQECLVSLQNQESNFLCARYGISQKLTELPADVQYLISSSLIMSLLPKPMRQIITKNFPATQASSGLMTGIAIHATNSYCVSIMGKILESWNLLTGGTIDSRQIPNIMKKAEFCPFASAQNVLAISIGSVGVGTDSDYDLLLYVMDPDDLGRFVVYRDIDPLLIDCEMPSDPVTSILAPLARNRGMRRQINSLSFMHDGRLVLSTPQGNIRTYNLETQQVLKVFDAGEVADIKGAKKNHRACSINHDKTAAALVCGEDVSIVNLSDKKIERIVEPNHPESLCNGVSFNRDGSLLLTLYGVKAQIWDFKTRKIMRELRIVDNDIMFGIAYVQFTPCSNFIVIQTLAKAQVKLYHVDTGMCLLVFVSGQKKNNADRFVDAKFSLDGSLFVVHSGNQATVWGISLFLKYIHALLSGKFSLEQLLFIRLLNDLARSGCRLKHLQIKESDMAQLQKAFNSFNQEIRIYLKLQYKLDW